MNEQNENIDILFKKKVEQLTSLPSSIKWSNSKGWKDFQKKYYLILPVRQHKLMLAASIALIITLGTLTFIFYNHQTRELCSFYGTNKQIKDIYLKGGHHCFLASDSKIQYCHSNYLSQADTLFLEGEGYFETSETKPLVVIAKNTVTRCINSKLNIKSIKSSKSTIISPVSGQVVTRCTDNGFPEMLVGPSEKCLVYEGGIYAAKEANDDRNFLAWKTGTLSFDNIPLTYAIKTIEDFYGVTIEVKSKDVKYCRITSEFNNTNIDEVLKYIQNSYKTKIKKSNNTIIVEDGICR
jgi:transmembrane sensor